MGSIHARVQTAAILVLMAFLGLGAVALDRAFRSSLEDATYERLMGQVYGLLAAAKEDRDGRIKLPDILPDPRLGQTDSGLYAEAGSSDADYFWRSASMLGREITFPLSEKPGVAEFQREKQTTGDYFALSYRILWADNAGAELNYRFSVAEEASGFTGQINAFRRTLLFWLGGVSLFLLVAQGMVLRWGLRPLREVSSDLDKIESGRAERLQGEYPKELEGLTHRINSLIHSGQASQARYRNSLGDLAHSLKTPLAVLQGAVEETDENALRAAVQEQVPRMNEIVQYQLKRAAASGFTGVQKAVSVMAVARRLIATLNKVYAEKGIKAELKGDASVEFRGDEGDLLEMLGNLLENAYKYSQLHVVFTTRFSTDNGSIEMLVEDDGEGIAPELRDKVINRGERADQRLPGQGIGLSVVDQIVRLYGGRLRIGTSNLGGALLEISIPSK